MKDTINNVFLKTKYPYQDILNFTTHEFSEFLQVRTYNTILMYFNGLSPSFIYIIYQSSTTPHKVC